MIRSHELYHSLDAFESIVVKLNLVKMIWSDKRDYICKCNRIMNHRQSKSYD